MAQGSITRKRAMFVWLPNFAMTLARLKKPPLAKSKEPLALVEKYGNIRRIAALDGPAAEAGLYLHQPLADALAIYPKLIFADAEPEACETALAALAAWAQRYSPFTAPAGASGLWLDIAGCAHLWGGEAQLAENLLGRLEARGIPARAAIAPTFGAAYALAHHAQRYVIAEQITYKLLLAPLPVERLRIAGETVSLLQKLGLFTIGAVQDLPRAGLSRRFPDLLPQLDKAMGLIPEAIAFQRLPTPWIERLRFPEPISAPEDLERTTAKLLEMLCERLETGRQGGLRFEMSFFRSDGGMETQAVTAALPTRDAARIARLFREKLALIDPGFGVDLAMLAAPHTEPLDERQESVLRPGQHAACVEELAALIDSLENRLGKGRVYRLAPQESYIPERAVKTASRYPGACGGGSSGGGGPAQEGNHAPQKTPALPVVGASPAAAAKHIGSLPSPCPSPSKPGLPGLQTKVISSASGCDGRGNALSTGTTYPLSHPHPLADADTLKKQARQDELARERAGVRGASAVWPSAGERPIRLFARPQPIDVTAALPDAPPVLFRWRKVLHRIVRAEGPERIEPEWWRNATDNAETRDYYRVESASGLTLLGFPRGHLWRRAPAPLVFARAVRMSRTPLRKARYAELQAARNFSFLEGGSHPHELVVRAVELGLGAIAVTDRNSLAGIVRAHLAARDLRSSSAKRDSAAENLRSSSAAKLALSSAKRGSAELDVKLIVGCRLTFMDGSPDLARAIRRIAPLTAGSAGC